LMDGQRWRYAAPDGHNVTWLAVDRGGLRLEEDGRVLREQIALFGHSRGVIEVQAEGESSFVFGSAKQDSNAVMQSDRLAMDTTVQAFVPSDMEEAAGWPVAAHSGPSLRVDSMNRGSGVAAAPVLDRRLARCKRQ